MPRMKVVLLADAPDALTRVCGVALLERQLRTLMHDRSNQVYAVGEPPEAIGALLGRPSWARAGILVSPTRRQDGPLTAQELAAFAGEDRVLFVPAAAVYDSRLLALLCGGTDSAALIDSDPPADQDSLHRGALRSPLGLIVGPAVFRPDWLAAQHGEITGAMRDGLAQGTLKPVDVARQPKHIVSMRRELRPYWFTAPSPATLPHAERLLLDSAQKGALDVPAYVHAPIENACIRLLCRTPVTPNQLTLITNAVAWVVVVLFAAGRLEAGVALALAVGVLDGLDGKQARVKVETSPGGKFEHYFDYVYETAWWGALAWYFDRTGALTGGLWLFLMLVTADLFDRVAKRAVKRSLGRDLDTIAPIDRFVRLVGARRNVFVWMLTVGVIAGQPAAAYLGIVLWGVLTATAHLIRTIWLLVARPAGVPVSPRPAR